MANEKRSLLGGSYESLVGSMRALGRYAFGVGGCEDGPMSAARLTEFDESSARMETARHQRSHGQTPLRELVRVADSSLLDELQTRLTRKRFRTGIRGLSRAEQNVWFVFELEGDVGNGGFHQYFSNSSGNCAVRALAALDEIGLTEYAKVLRAAFAVFGSAPAEDRFLRNRAMGRVPNEFRAWSECDREFYDLRRAESVLAAYVRDRVEQFDLDAD